MTTQEAWVAMVAAMRAGDLWWFVLAMVGVIVLALWYEWITERNENKKDVRVR